MWKKEEQLRNMFQRNCPILVNKMNIISNPVMVTFDLDCSLAVVVVVNTVEFNPSLARINLFLSPAVRSVI